MEQLSVAILARDDEERRILEMQVDATGVARTVLTLGAFPAGATDLILRRLQDIRTDVTLVHIGRSESAAALHTIELLQSELPTTTVFAIGDTSQPQAIIHAMRAGAREFLEHPTSTNSLLEAFVRLTTVRKKSPGAAQQGKVFTFINAKGGCGATTIAVNTAMALQAAHGSGALVDLAPLGHAAIHLNVNPAFTVLDALRNVHRMDASLLDGYVTHSENGLDLLAGAVTPMSIEIPTSDYARLFDILVSHYKWVVVDASSRLDTASRAVCDLSHLVLLVALTDFASLWSAGRVQEFVSGGTGSDRVRLVLNRYHKIVGFSDTHIESAAHAKILFKVPNNYSAIAAAIDRGTPVTQQHHSDIARSFKDLAAHLFSQHARAQRREASGSR